MLKEYVEWYSGEHTIPHPNRKTIPYHISILINSSIILKIHPSPTQSPSIHTTSHLHSATTSSNLQNLQLSLLSLILTLNVATIAAPNPLPGASICVLTSRFNDVYEEGNYKDGGAFLPTYSPLT
jgi:hypothetical protein